MYNRIKLNESLNTKRIRYAFSIKASAAVMFFFAAAWSLLQWTLASGPQYLEGGLPRNFVVIESALCLAAAACALAYLVASSVAWGITVFRLHEGRGAKARRRLALKKTSRRLAFH